MLTTDHHRVFLPVAPVDMAVIVKSYLPVVHQDGAGQANLTQAHGSPPYVTQLVRMLGARRHPLARDTVTSPRPTSPV